MSEKREQSLEIANSSIKETMRAYIMFRLRRDVPIKEVEEEMKGLVHEEITAVDTYLDDVANQIAKSLE